MSHLSNFSAEELFALATQDFKREYFEGTLDKLKLLFIRNQAPLEAYSLMGRTYASIGLFDQAKQALSKFLEESPGAINETFQLGMIEKDLGNAEDAMQLWESVLAKAPEFPPALYHSASQLAETDQVQTAIERLNIILETAADEDSYVVLADKLISKLSLQ